MAASSMKLPLSGFPPEARDKLAKAWDPEKRGYVTVDELAAGANGGNSGREARLNRMTGRSSERGAALVQSSPAGRSLEAIGGGMPGDIAELTSIGEAEGQHIWHRMAAIIRKRRLDVRILMDAHDRRNCGYIDISTFRRSLCYAFGNQWIELAMTSAEFHELCAPYLTRQSTPVAGEPEQFVFWQKFATDLQKLADTRAPSDGFLGRLAKVEARESAAITLQNEYNVTEYELKTAFACIKERMMAYSKRIIDVFHKADTNRSGTLSGEEIRALFKDAKRTDVINDRTLSCIIDMADANGDDAIGVKELADMLECDDVLELTALVKDKRKVSGEKIENERVVGKYGIKVKELKQAQQAIKERLLLRHKTVAHALRALDTDNSGSISRDELVKFLADANLIKRADYYSGEVSGSISMAVIDTLLDFVDSGAGESIGTTKAAGKTDGLIDYEEFTRIITSENIFLIAEKHDPNAKWGGPEKVNNRGKFL